jgi:hypothetical protein
MVVTRVVPLFLSFELNIEPSVCHTFALRIKLPVTDSEKSRYQDKDFGS